MAEKTILLAEDDASIRLVASQTLSSAGFTVRATGSIDALERWVREGQGAAVVSDVYLGDTSVFERLSSLKLARPELPFIIMSAQNTILTAAAAAEHGAFDYLPKPFDIDALTEAVQRAIKGTHSRAAPTSQMRQTQDDARLPLIGRSEAMQETYRIITRVMNTDLTVLITGEPGTGKDLAARAIHDLGAARDGQFLQLDAGHLIAGPVPDEELSAASTIYIDEVGDLSQAAQANMLALLRQKKRGRIIASTRHNMSRLVEDDNFREDLYYRLGVVRLNMPALRRRKEDIPELTRSLLLRATENGLPEKSLDDSAIDLLSSYDWPGNVRELENVILRLCALSSDPSITARNVEQELRTTSYAELPRETSFEEEVETLLKRHILSELMGSRPGDDSDDEENTEERVYQRVIDRVERPLLKLALQVTNGNKVKAAAILGVNRNTLRSKINGLGIQDE